MNDLQRRILHLEAGQKRKRDALAVLDTLDIKKHIAPVYIPLHEDIKAQAHST